jgi:hypothetical protein
VLALPSLKNVKRARCRAMVLATDAKPNVFILSSDLRSASACVKPLWS